MKNLTILITCLILIGNYNANAQFGFIKKTAKKAGSYTVKKAKKVGSATKKIGKKIGKNAVKGTRIVGRGAKGAGKFGVNGAKKVGRGAKRVGKGAARGATNMVNSKVGNAIVKTVSAPAKAVFNTTKVITGQAGVGSIYKPYKDAYGATGKAVPSVIKVITTPHRMVYQKVKKIRP